MMLYKNGIFLAADLFCGAGGSSTGAKNALESLGLKLELVAVNHWDKAIATHQKNHVDARHFCINLDSASPRELIPEGYLDLLMASPECFPAGTSVITKNGPVPIEDIREGVEVLTHKLRWRRVTSIMASVKDTVAICGFNGAVLETTAEHPFYAKRLDRRTYGEKALDIFRKKAPKWVRASRLAKEGMCIASPKSQLPDDEQWRPVVSDDSFNWYCVTDVKPGRKNASVYNLSVEEDESYVAAGFVSHNCTHFSTARGSAPMSDQSRMSGWHIERWITDLDIRNILIENVPEYTSWGPLNPRTKRPIESKKGIYFQAFIASMRDVGYNVDYRILNAADYGEATSRRRLFILCRKDGNPIIWPEPSHSQTGEADLFGQKPKWRGAREIIDWSRKGTSIFGRKKPLAPKTIARILAGAEKFGWHEPLVTVLREYLKTREYEVAQKSGSVPATCKGASVNSKSRKEACCGDMGSLKEMSIIGRNMSHNVPVGLDEPIPTITTAGNIFKVDGSLESMILNRHGDNGSIRCHSIEDPMPSATTRGAGYVVTPELNPLDGFSEVQGAGNGVFTLSQASGGAPRSILSPLSTIVSAGKISIIKPVMIEVNHQDGTTVRQPLDVDKPLPTVTAKRGLGVAEAVLVKMRGTGTAVSIEAPTPTITAQGRHLALAEGMLFEDAGNIAVSMKGTNNTGGCAIKGNAAAMIAPFYSSGSGESCKSPDLPLDTITGKGHFGLVEPFISQFYGHNKGVPRVSKSIDDPIPTITAEGNRFGLVDGELKPFIVPQFGEREGQNPRNHDIDDPLPAVTSHGAGAVVEAAITTAEPLLVQIDNQGKKGRKGGVRSVKEPLYTNVSKANQAVVQGKSSPLIVQTDQTGSNGCCVRPVEMPLFTMTSALNIGVAEATVEKLNENFFDSPSAKKGIPVLVGGKPYLLDIVFRMLEPNELSRAMGFSDANAEYNFVGTKVEITKQIGNAVSVRTAKALVTVIVEAGRRGRNVQRVA